MDIIYRIEKQNPITLRWVPALNSFGYQHYSCSKEGAEDIIDRVLRPTGGVFRSVGYRFP